MNKFSLDYGSLQGNMDEKKSYKLSDVKDRIRKVAFDVVKFNDSDNIDGLWQIQNCEDGEYIVAMYNGADEEVVTKSSSSWNVVADSAGYNVNIFYKNSPVGKVSLASLGIPSSESYLVCDYLPAKLASNPALVTGLLEELSEGQREDLFQKYPELK